MSQSEIAYRYEDNGQFQAPTPPGGGGPAWIQPGIDIEVQDLSIDNNLTRNRHPDETSSQESRVGNFTGELSLSWTYTDDNWHTLIPFTGNDDLRGDHRLAETAQIYINVSAFDDSLTQFNQALAFAGCALTSADITYSEGDLITVDATIGLGEAISNPSPSSIQQPNANQVFAHHGTALTVDGTTQSGAREATISMPNLAYRSDEADRVSRKWAVAGDMELEFSLSAEFSEVDQLESAIGGSDVTSVSDFLSPFSSTSMQLSNGQATTVTYTLSDLTPSDATLNQVAAPDDDVLEDLTYHVGNLSV
jgi:hypothetical protein